MAKDVRTAGTKSSPRVEVRRSERLKQTPQRPQNKAPKEKLGRLALLECDFAVEEHRDGNSDAPEEPAEKRRHSERVMPQQRTVLRRFSFQELEEAAKARCWTKLV
ncbi:unnamed protein product [Durusdinium trenchii]|uniref:Uncharacterized protein n=1 Tax=Durusdinium trenchii TaxID=1381693 RepID=A0ABP0QYM5_9DINO